MNKKRNIRLATEADLDQLAQLYDDINDYLEVHVNYPGWKKGIYPTREDAEAGIREGCLFVAEEDKKIIGTMILRHRPEPAYLTVKWQEELDYEKVFVIYTFVVSPTCLQQGIGAGMLEYAAQYGKEQGVRSLRLDVTEQNVPAMKLYEKCGFIYVDTVSLGLEDIGLDWFKLYEKLLD